MYVYIPRKMFPGENIIMVKIGIECALWVSRALFYYYLTSMEVR